MCFSHKTPSECTNSVAEVLNLDLILLLLSPLPRFQNLILLPVMQRTVQITLTGHTHQLHSSGAIQAGCGQSDFPLKYD